MNDNVNLNGSVVVLSHNRLVCKISCPYSKTDVRDEWSPQVGNSPDSTTVQVLRGKGRESSVLDVNAGYIHCINNQCNVFDHLIYQKARSFRTFSKLLLALQYETAKYMMEPNIYLNCKCQ